MVLAGENISRLALGTAQLGMSYGVANVVGRPGANAARQIVEAAWEAGINCFDTAQSYDSSEAMLGLGLKRLGAADRALVVTKTASELEQADEARILWVVRSSLGKVGVERFFGLLMHKEEWLADWETHRRRFSILLEKGLVRHLGVSLYESDSFETAVHSEGIDLIQAPFNVFDQRALRLGWLAAARSANKVLFLRSVFLQGLLLLPPEKIGSRLGFARRPLDDFHECCRQARLTPLRAALGYALAKTSGAVVIFGADTFEQVQQVVSLAREVEDGDFPADLFDRLAQPEDSPLIDPRKWRLN